MAKKEMTAQESKVLKSCYMWGHTVFLNFNQTKMEANCFTMAMSPAIESIYGDDMEGKKEAYARHQAFFNTHTAALQLILGLCVAMEKDVHDGKIPGSTIEAIKAALMGPTAGMFDALFFNCLRVIVAGICIGLANQGNPLAPLLFVLLYAGTQEIARWTLINLGYSLGTSFIDVAFKSGVMNILTRCASIMGLTMVGAMTATTVNVPLKWVLSVGGTEVVILDVLNSIYPGILSIALVLLMLNLIKKGKRPVALIIGILVFGVVGAFLGLF